MKLYEQIINFYAIFALWLSGFIYGILADQSRVFTVIGLYFLPLALFGIFGILFVAMNLNNRVYNLKKD